MVKQRLVGTVLLSLSMGLVSGCSGSPEPQAEHVTRSDLVGEWHAGGMCDSSLRLEEGGSARVSRWPISLNDQGGISQRKNGTGTWMLEAFQGRQELQVKLGKATEAVLLRESDSGLMLLQIPGDDPDNSIGCRFTRVHEPG
ncbi:hypothetical protein QOM21_02480 [Streptomyces sp. Pv4-95]|uniref:hypothetical protein n=1 Tax=Streptomyces sp. Pv4-95 TaxID=3049543 RepID=UPI003891A722